MGAHAFDVARLETLIEDRCKARGVGALDLLARAVKPLAGGAEIVLLGELLELG